MSGSVGYLPETSPFLRAVRLRDRARAVWSWFTHSSVGLVLLQIPLLPILMIRAPTTIAVDLAPLSVAGKSFLTAAMLWFTVQQRI